MHRIMSYIGIACGLTLLGLVIYYFMRDRWRAMQPVRYVRPGDPDCPPDEGKPHGHHHNGRHHRNQI